MHEVRVFEPSIYRDATAHLPGKNNKTKDHKKITDRMFSFSWSFFYPQPV